MGMKMIKVSEENWKKLMHLKIEKGFSSVDDVITYLLRGGRKNET